MVKIITTEKQTDQEAMIDEHIITTLDQAKALFDELRLRMVNGLGSDLMTTKQLAEKLVEKPTKLYHHMEVLEKNGLVRVVETRIKSGIIEKYYQVVAKRFRIAGDLFNAEDEAAIGSIMIDALQEMLDKTLNEFKKLNHASSDDACESNEEVFITHQKVKLSPRRIKKLHQKINDLTDFLKESNENDGEETLLTLVCLPLIENDDSNKKKSKK